MRSFHGERVEEEQEGTVTETGIAASGPAKGAGFVEPEEDFDAPRPFLGPLLRDLRPYRRVIWGSVALAVLVAVAWGTLQWVLAPVEQMASLDFRIEFDGVQDGKYPNGMKFSMEDILSEPVVRRVFDDNDLKRYAPYERFRAALVVTSTNRDLEAMERDYQGRLADPKLMPVERLRLEREFREKLAALKTSGYTLWMFRRERLRQMSPLLMDKVLRGILAAWAEDVAKTRGALKYDVPTYGPTGGIEKEFLGTEDQLVSIDMLRTKVNRVLTNIDKLMKIPGIQIVRTTRTGTTLPEIKARLEELNTYKIAPLLGIIRATGLSKDSASAMRYLENRAFEVGLEQTVAQDRERKTREAFDAYLGTDRRAAAARADAVQGAGREAGTSAVIPQFSESFIDRLMTLANRNSDVAFRQDLIERIITAGLEQADAAREASFYRELLSSFRNSAKGGGDASVRAAVLKDIEARFSYAAGELEKAIAGVVEIYDIVSVRNLRPSSALYSTDRPVRVLRRTGFSIARMLGLTIVLAGFVGCVATGWALVRARLASTKG